MTDTEIYDLCLKTAREVVGGFRTEFAEDDMLDQTLWLSRAVDLLWERMGEQSYRQHQAIITKTMAWFMSDQAMAVRLGDGVMNPLQGSVLQLMVGIHMLPLVAKFVDQPLNAAQKEGGA